jgi:hypothetical protein
MMKIKLQRKKFIKTVMAILRHRLDCSIIEVMLKKSLLNNFEAVERCNLGNAFWWIYSRRLELSGNEEAIRRCALCLLFPYYVDSRHDNERRMHLSEDSWQVFDSVIGSPIRTSSDYLNALGGKDLHLLFDVFWIEYIKGRIHPTTG